MGETDGKVVVEIDLETKKFDQKVAKLTRRLEKEETKLKIKDDDVKRAQEDLKLLEQEYDNFKKENASITKEVNQKIKEYARLEELRKSGQRLTPEEGSSYISLFNELEELKEKKENLNKQDQEFVSNIDKANQKLEKTKMQYNDISSNVQLIKNDLNLMKQTQQLKELDKIKGSINSIGDGIRKATGKVVKWGLAVFGVRSAYLGIRRAMSTISQYDEQMGANIEYLKYALAMVLKPVIEWIINAVYKLLQYINYIAHAWFGINLFANSSVKAFNKMNNSAKKVQKTLAGFDEMNILNDNEDKGYVGPSFDLNNLGNVEIPDWVKWIAENKDTILTVAGIVAGIFGANVIAGWISNLSGFIHGSQGLGLLSSKLAKISAIAGGIAITTLVATKVWQEAEQLKKDIQQIREAGSKGQEEWIKNEKDLNKLIDTGNVNRTAGYKLLEKSGGVWNWINGLGKENLETAKQTAINISKQIDKELELYKNSNLTNEEQKKIRDNIVEQYKYNSQVIAKLRENKQETSQIEDLNKRLIQNYKDMGGNVTEMHDDLKLVGIKLGEINSVEFDDKHLNVEVDAKTAQAESKLTTMIDKIKNNFNEMFKNINLKPLADKIESSLKLNDKITGLNLADKFRVARKQLGLAKGGIISMPGKGVPIAPGVVGGERQMEGVFPLTDAQQMELMGAAIGKYVVINLTNVTELDGREIARKVDKIQQNNNFVLNR